MREHCRETSSRRGCQGRREMVADWLSELILIEDDDTLDIFAVMEFGAEARGGRKLRWISGPKR
jgi:hypothetical protein